MTARLATLIASLPLWLAPTQVRLIPVNEDHVKLAMDYAKRFNRGKVRADVDDRTETVQKKVREAEKEWIPYIIVLGEREVGAEKLPVRVRSDGKLHKMSLTELSSEIKKQVRGKPYRPLPLPMSVQGRPKFVGSGPQYNFFILIYAVAPLLYLPVHLAAFLVLLVVILAEVGPLPLDVQPRGLRLGEGDGSDGVILAARNRAFCALVYLPQLTSPALIVNESKRPPIKLMKDRPFYSLH